MKHKFLFSLLLAFAVGGEMVVGQTSTGDYARQVNTLIGTKGTGLTSGYLYPGATYPYGMVQFTPSYFSKSSGFVINQLSGGGCDHMGNFPTFPVKGKLSMSPDNILNYRVNLSEEKGHAGYYETMVQEDIKAKLTVTERTGMANYEYPAGQQYGTVIIGGGISATPIEQAAVVITAPNKCEGYAEGGYFCGIRTPYKVYFVAEFDTDALETGTWKRNELKPNSSFAEGEYSGVYFTFDVSKKKNVQYKIGVSYVQYYEKFDQKHNDPRRCRRHCQNNRSVFQDRPYKPHPLRGNELLPAGISCLFRAPDHLHGRPADCNLKACFRTGDR